MSWDFSLQIFSWIIFPKPLKITPGPLHIFSKILRDILKWRCTTGINDTGGKFCHQFRWCCWHRWQICHRCQRRRWQITATGVSDTGGKQWEQYQTSDNLKWTWRKIYLYANSTVYYQRCQKMKTFLTEDFFRLTPVSTTPVVVHLELWISPRIFNKIRNGPNSIVRGLAETGPCREPDVKNLVALSL